MITPAGKECHYYYEDFHRGRSTQECRLIQQNSASPRWRPNDCFHCPVPNILWANASEYLELHGTIKPGFIFGLGRQVAVEAYCTKHHVEIEDPYVGCPQCAAERPGLEAFFEGED
jgi:hypothetical protein